jgi:uncharacterized protein (UPF0548 family)
MSPREFTPDEGRVLERLVSGNWSGAEIAREQMTDAQYGESLDLDLCFSIHLPGSSALPRLDAPDGPITGLAVEQDGEATGSIDLWIADGLISSVEYSWFTEHHPEVWPTDEEMVEPTGPAFTYAAVGATRTPDRLPPPRYRLLERRVRIGSGRDVFDRAGRKVLSWEVQMRSGILVVDLLRGHIAESVSVGQLVELRIPFRPVRVLALARVVYIEDTDTRRGFAYGTLTGHPERGEEAFLVEIDGDGQVWFVLRAFSRPAGFFWFLVEPILLLTQWYYTRRYLRALL